MKRPHTTKRSTPTADGANRRPHGPLYGCSARGAIDARSQRRRCRSDIAMCWSHGHPRASRSRRRTVVAVRRTRRRGVRRSSCRSRRTGNAATRRCRSLVASSFWASETHRANGQARGCNSRARRPSSVGRCEARAKALELPKRENGREAAAASAPFRAPARGTNWLRGEQRRSDRCHRQSALFRRFGRGFSVPIRAKALRAQRKRQAKSAAPSATRASTTKKRARDVTRLSLSRLCAVGHAVAPLVRTSYRTRPQRRASR